MRNFLQNFAYKLQRFMIGRYGTDELNILLSIIGFILVILSFVPPMRFLYIPAFILLLFSLFRSYSRNISARQKERRIYLNLKYKISSPFSLTAKKWRDRKTHKYYKCKKCKAIMRVPKGKGKIEITCPKCANKIIKKT